MKCHRRNASHNINTCQVAQQHKSLQTGSAPGGPTTARGKEGRGGGPAGLARLIQKSRQSNEMFWNQVYNRACLSFETIWAERLHATISLWMLISTHRTAVAQSASGATASTCAQAESQLERNSTLASAMASHEARMWGTPPLPKPHNRQTDDWPPHTLQVPGPSEIGRNHMQMPKSQGSRHWAVWLLHWLVHGEYICIMYISIDIFTLADRE